MRTVKSLVAAICSLTVVVFFATATPVQSQEPHYLHALSALRSARDYLQYDRGAPHGVERRHAVDEINKAINEIKHAAWDDGKNTQFAPPAQGVTTGWAPVHQAQRWLNIAQGHVEQGVDTPQNRGLRDRILFHIHEARRTLEAIMGAGVP